MSLIDVLLQGSLGKMLFTTDVWSDPNMTSFMAVAAHWIQASPSMNGSNNLMLQADLIGFHCIPGRHDGQHLAAAFLHVLD